MEKVIYNTVEDRMNAMRKMVQRKFEWEARIREIMATQA